MNASTQQAAKVERAKELDANVSQLELVKAALLSLHERVDELMALAQVIATEPRST